LFITGKWKSAEEITEMVAPSKEVSNSVVEFLRAQGAPKVENFGDMVKVTASVSWVEEVLQTSLFFFQHKTKTSKVIIRAVGGYRIPSAIEEHVDFVAGLFEFPSIRDFKRDDVFAGVDGYVVPYVITNLYNIPTSYPVHPNSSICLVEFQDDQSYDKDDLTTFSKQNDIPQIVVSHIVGPFDGSEPDAESTLDVQYGAAIALNSTVWFWTVADWMYDFATDFLNTPKPPLVVSMSWGWPEPNQCDVGDCTGDETSLQYVQRTNVEFQKIGLLGVTLIAASGDQGAPGDSNPDCTSRKQPLSTIFPGASPWVLSVGATMLSNNTSSEKNFANPPPICQTHTCSTSTTEEVCSYPEALITTGGGFSNYVARPSYQNTAVANYLSSGVPLPPAADFNSSNRGFPDISALGHNYLIALSGEFEQVDGTSCSAPVIGGMIALLNSYRLNNNKPPLGFIIPLIYQAFTSDPSIYTDITTGDNKCTENCCDKYGYEATKGWDPVTGVGTPNFAKLLAFVQTLP
jgi:subtilase family serine protease